MTNPKYASSMTTLDAASCYAALLARDLRFDGKFFVGVTTTKIYCRPICPAPSPKLTNCLFFQSAAAAQDSGLRPCLRCRPETAPFGGAWRGTSSTVSRALMQISSGKLDEKEPTYQSSQNLSASVSVNLGVSFKNTWVLHRFKSPKPDEFSLLNNFCMKRTYVWKTSPSPQGSEAPADSTRLFINRTNGLQVNGDRKVELKRVRPRLQSTNFSSSSFATPNPIVGKV